MPEPYLTIVLAIVGSGVLTTILTAVINRKQSKAQMSDTLVEAAKKLVDEHQEDLARIRQERKEDQNSFAQYKKEAADEFAAYKKETTTKIHELEAELEIQENAIDNLVMKTGKYQLYISIIVNQLRTIGLEPVIDPGDIEGMKIEDMRLIAEGASNVERRRRERSKKDD